MRWAGLIFIQSFAALIVGLAGDADAQGAAPYDWRGFYAGVHIGAGLSLVDIKDPFGDSIFNDTARTSGALAGGQLGYNWQFGSALLGLEAEASWADLDGTNTCFAYSGFYSSSTCHAHIDALGTLTARVGWALPGDGRTLLYGKAGLALKHASTNAFVNYHDDANVTHRQGFGWGVALGGGVERALNSRWSLKTEYDYLGFGDEGFAAPRSLLQTVVGAPGTRVTVPETAISFSSNTHELKLGLNYRLCVDEAAPAWEWGAAPDGRSPPPSGFAIEAGVRYVRGWGRFHKDQQVSFAHPNLSQSRLTYDGMSTNGKEVFGRLDTPFDLMVKGLVGIGKGGGGTLNDEDWALGPPAHVDFIPYSNTVGTANEKITYGIIDVGYDLWRTPQTSLAPFVGYSYFREDMYSGGCFQIANSHSDCRHPVPLSRISLEDLDTWKSVRLGAVLGTMLAPRLKLDADVAYLPRVKVEALNHHYLKQEEAPEWGHGTGVQLEAILSYALSKELSVGVGGRYWSMWTANGATDKSGAIYPMRLATEQAALLVQGSYSFGAAAGPN